MTSSIDCQALVSSAAPPGTWKSRLAGAHVATTLVLVALVVLPFLVSDYRSFQVATILAYAVALLGLNLLTGYNGQFSLGHGAFFALGAYVAAIFSTKLGMPFWLTVPLAGGVGFCFGFLFGLPALRLGSLYLALATFSLALAVPQLLKWKKAEALTGGVLGVTMQKPGVPAWLPISQDQLLYFFTLAVTAIMFLLARNLIASRMGRVLVAIREQPVAATAAGVHLALVKSTTFGISVAYTSVAGALSAWLVQYVAPDSFTAMLSITMLVGIVVGGVATLWGPVFGAIFIVLVPSAAESVAKSAPGLVYGLALLLCIFVMPGGVAGTLQSLVRRLAGRRAGA
jgi:branched-chain amino acid transport system permease protein